MLVLSLMFWLIDNKTLHIKKYISLFWSPFNISTFFYKADYEDDASFFLQGFCNHTKKSAQQKMLLNMALPEAHFKTIKASQENKRK